MDIISCAGISLEFDRGIIDHVTIERGGKTLRPLHRAPWVTSGEALPDSVASVERRLAGDFFCAPFARSAPGVPIHGWSANGTWRRARTIESDDGIAAVYDLEERVAGARLTKTIALRDGHPVVYQTHVFEGGQGSLPIAHHAMLHLPGGARLSFSPKLEGRTLPEPPETDPARGRSALAYPQRFDGLSKVRKADGGWVDARSYPFDTGHEDLIVLSEKPGARIGWSAAVAADQGFVFFALKDARVLPQTVLWMSNGGRHYAPWNSRHIAVLGMEEAATALHLAPEEMLAGEANGVPFALPLNPDGKSVVRYAFGAIPVPSGWSEIADIRLEGEEVILADVGGGRQGVSFDQAFFND